MPAIEDATALAGQHIVVVGNGHSAATTIGTLSRVAKREPGKLHYSSPGNGGPQHLAMELLKLETGMNIVMAADSNMTKLPSTTRVGTLPLGLSLR